MAEPTDPKTQVGAQAAAAKKAAAEERILAATEAQRVEAEKLLQTLKEQNEALAEQDAIQERIARQTNEREIAYGQALKDRTRLQKELEGLRMESEENRDKAAIKDTDRELQQAKKTIKEMERQETAAQKELDLIKQKRQEIEKLNADTKALAKDNELAKDMQEFGDASEETQKKLNSLQGVMGETFKEPGTGGPLGAYVRFTKGLSSAMTDSLARIRKMGGGTVKFGNIVKFMNNTLAQGGGFLLAFGAALASVGMRIDSLSKGIQKAGGIIEKGMTDNLIAVADAGMRAGVGLSEAAAAMKALRDGTYSAFQIGGPHNNELALTVARLNEIGVGSATSAKALDHFQRTMGISAEKASDLVVELSMMGVATGISTTQMMKDFDAVSSRLAIFGDKNIKVFAELEAMVKATGVAIGDLTKMAKTYDKFDTAADSVAKMNAVLGTQLSTIDMMMKSDSDRVIAVTQQVRATIGGDFDRLNKFEKMYVAQAMGIEDVAKAQRLLNMDTAEYSKHLDSMKAQKATQEDLRKASEQLLPVTQQLKLLMDNLFIKVAPFAVAFVDFISKTIDGLIMLQPLVLAVGAGLAIWAVWAMIAAGAFTTMGIPLLVAGITALAAVLGYATEETENMHQALVRPGSPPFYELPGILAAGFSGATKAIEMAKSAMAATKGALGGLWDIFHKPGSPMLFMLPEVFAAGFVTLAESISNVIRDINEFVSLMIQVAQLDFKGFVALRTDSTGTSMVMGSEDVLTSISQGKLTVDVKMPKLEVPKVDVKVFIGNEEFKGYIKTVAAGAVMGAI